MEVNIYIRFWTLKMEYTQHGLYGQVAFKNARVGPSSRDRDSGFFDVTPAHHPDECNTRWGYLESLKHWDLDWLCPKISPNTHLEIGETLKSQLESSTHIKLQWPAIDWHSRNLEHSNSWSPSTTTKSQIQRWVTHKLMDCRPWDTTVTFIVIFSENERKSGRIRSLSFVYCTADECLILHEIVMQSALNISCFQDLRCLCQGCKLIGSVEIGDHNRRNPWAFEVHSLEPPPLKANNRRVFWKWRGLLRWGRLSLLPKGFKPVNGRAHVKEW